MLENKIQTTSQPVQTIINETDLREYLRKVYNFMAGGLVVTALTAYIIMSSPNLFRLFFSVNGNTISLSGLGWLILIAPLAMVFYFNSVARNGSARKLQVIFWIFSALIGISLTPTVMLYTGASIARVFLITAAMFGGMSIYGYTTEKDLSSMGSLCLMALWGIIIAAIVNIFMGSTALSMGVSVLSVLVFTGLTAYDTQKLRLLYLSSGNMETLNKTALVGALELYLDFVNMFLALLRLLGNRR